MADKDTCLLCTDGLWGSLPEADLRSALLHTSTPEEACKELLALTLREGGGDNLSAVVFTVCGANRSEKRSSPLSFFHTRN